MFYIIALLAVAADLLSKKAVEAAFAVGETRVLIKGLLDFHHLRNYGAAYSILQNKVSFLLIFTGVLLAGIVIYYVKNHRSMHPVEMLCLSFILGGGIGNFISRITVGYVTDFIDIHIIPVFNVADIFVSTGCFLLLFYYFFIEGKKDSR